MMMKKNAHKALLPLVAVAAPQLLLLLQLLLSSMSVCFAEEQLPSLRVGPSPNPLPVSQSAIDNLSWLKAQLELRWLQFDRLCDTNATFALTYAMMTRAIADGVANSYFDNGDQMAHFTLTFAKRYTDALDSRYVPPAWREAFHWQESCYSSVEEDLMHGISAHINFDLAIATWESGSARTTSLKADFDRINDLLGDIMPAVADQLCARYSESMCPGTPQSILSPLIFQQIVTWREIAWQNARALERSTTAAERELIINQLSLRAVIIAKLFQLPKLFPTCPEKEAYCRAYHETHPGESGL
eukprot:GEZU01012364.1.p1 GENE.GEZU01012364.1~~GEZU01012364.1.p1  ORF type:complete len:301 (-),score=26.97 GEZU01012364.1:293-1195(-)